MAKITIRKYSIWMWSILSVGILLVVHVPSLAFAADSLVIAYSGNMDGEYEACGCPGSPMGGIPRRATVLSRLRKEDSPLLVLDAGNALMKGALALAAVGEMEGKHGELIARLMGEVGIQAVAVGPRDLWAVGLTELRRIARVTGVQWLSANIVDEGAEPIFPAHVILSAGPFRVGVFGLTEPQMLVAEREGFRYIDPIAAGQAQVGHLKDKVDLIVALSNLPYEGLWAVREKVPGIDLIISGVPGGGAPPVSPSGPPWIVMTHGQGRSLGRLDLRLVPGSSQPLMHAKNFERELRDLGILQDSLEDLRRTIIEEEGLFNPVRFDREGHFLKTRIQKLLDDRKWQEAEVRVFGYRDIPLLENIREDETLLKKTRALERSLAIDVANENGQ